VDLARADPRVRIDREASLRRVRASDVQRRLRLEPHPRVDRDVDERERVGHEDGARVAEAHRTLEMPRDVDEPLDRAALVAHGHARGEHTLEAVAVPAALPRRLATLTRTAHDERDAAPGRQLE